MITKLKYLELFDNYKPKEKNIYGFGVEHQIYSSLHNPNILYKIGTKETIYKWCEIFKSNPDIFPKVFKVSKMSGKDYYCVTIEKLDTEKFEEEWDNLEITLEDIGAIDADSGENFTDLYFQYSNNPSKMEEISEDLKKFDLNSSIFYLELINVISETKKAILKFTGKPTKVDIHKYNYGYSKDGKIKCLDI